MKELSSILSKKQQLQWGYPWGQRSAQIFAHRHFIGKAAPIPRFLLGIRCLSPNPHPKFGTTFFLKFPKQKLQVAQHEDDGLQSETTCSLRPKACSACSLELQEPRCCRPPQHSQGPTGPSPKPALNPDAVEAELVGQLVKCVNFQILHFGKLRDGF